MSAQIVRYYIAIQGCDLIRWGVNGCWTAKPNFTEYFSSKLKAERVASEFEGAEVVTLRVLDTFRDQPTMMRA